MVVAIASMLHVIAPIYCCASVPEPMLPMNAHSLSDRSPELAPSLLGIRDEPRRALERIALMRFRWVQLGVTQSGLRPRDLDSSARRDLLAMLRRHELDLAGLDFFIPTEHYFDPAQVDRAVTASRAAIELAADLGRRPVSLVLPATTETDDDRSTMATEVRGALLDASIRCGVPLADHGMPPSMTEPDDLIGVGIDAALCLSMGDDPAAIVSRQSATIVAARLCDLTTAGHRAPLGESDGRLDPLQYGVALITAGYARPVVIDVRQWIDPWVGIERTAAVWRKELQISV